MGRRRIHFPIPCRGCGKEFTPRFRESSCSISCAQRSRHGSHQGYHCVGCGRSFWRERRSQIGNSADKRGYCSRECAYRNINQWHPVRKTKSKPWAQGHKCRDCETEITGRVLRCDECRARAHATTLAEGRETFTLRYRPQLAAAKKSEPRVCKECRQEFAPEYGNKRRAFCSRLCLRRFGQRASKAIRRTHAKSGERFSAREIFERDRWRCGLCGQGIDRHLRSPHERCATIDHIVPIARGGQHERRNVQAAHRECNWRKGVASCGSQLRLVG